MTKKGRKNVGVGLCLRLKIIFPSQAEGTDLF